MAGVISDLKKSSIILCRVEPELQNEKSRVPGTVCQGPDHGPAFSVESFLATPRFPGYIAATFAF